MIDRNQFYATLLWSFKDSKDDYMDENYDMQNVHLSDMEKMDKFHQSFFEVCINKGWCRADQATDFAHNLVLDITHQGEGFWSRKQTFPFGKEISKLLHETISSFECYESKGRIFIDFYQKPL